MRPVENSGAAFPTVDGISGGALDFVSGAPAGGDYDLASAVGGEAPLFNSDSNGVASFLGTVGNAFGGAPGQVLGQLVGSVFTAFAGPKTDEAQQSADINKIAAWAGIRPTEAAAVVAYHADHSSDNFNDLAKYVANENPPHFDKLLEEYNGGNSAGRITKNSLVAAQQAAAQQQEQLIQTATTSPDFLGTATGQHLVAALSNLPGSQLVGTSGQTAGQALQQISQSPAAANAVAQTPGEAANQVVKSGLAGLWKGLTDGFAGTEAGQGMKRSYLGDWIKENQLLAAALGVIAVTGVVVLGKAILTALGVGRKVSA